MLRTIGLLLSLPLLGFACGAHESGDDASVAARDQQQAPMFASFGGMKPPPQVPTPKRIVIKNARVFNGDSLDAAGKVVINGATLGIYSEDITYDEEVDAEGGVLFPGFIDAHNHPSGVKDLEALTKHGVTTTLSMACAPLVVCNMLRNRPGLSDFHAAIQAATSPSSPHAKMVPYDPNDLISSPDDAARFVASQAGNGSEWIKLVAEKGGMTQADHDALVTEAQRYNLKTATHVGDVATMQMAIDSGSNMLQHVPRDGLITKKMATSMLKKGQTITPTLAVIQFFAEKRHSGSLQTALDNTALLYKQGIPIMTGTDAAFFFDVAFGSSLHDEFELLSQAGVPNLEILRSATSVPARVFGLDDRGVISPGKRADLVLLKENPLDDITNTRTIRRVWVKGLEYTDVAGAAAPETPPARSS